METDFAQTKSSKFPTRPQKHPLSAWDLRWLPEPKTPTQNLKNRQSALPRVVLLNTHFARTHAWLYLYFGGGRSRAVDPSRQNQNYDH